MLILLLPAIFIVVFLNLTGYHFRQRTPLADWRMAFLQSATFMGGYMVLVSEFLSLFHALTTLWLAFFWGLALVAAIIIGWKTGWLYKGFNSLKAGWKKPGWFDILAGTILAIIFILLFFIALKSPSNNNDSLRYHLARVAHWIQNGNLSHFATAYLPQVMHPIGAELAILNAILLWGNDGLANLIQWFCMVGVLVGVSTLVSLLGGSRTAQWLAVAFAISLPVGLLEASSTQNDYVTAFWLITLLCFIFFFQRQENTVLDSILIGLAFGMGILVKASFYPYAFAPMVYFTIIIFRRLDLLQTLKSLLLIVALAVLLNLGFWSRNFASFHSPFGQKDFVSAHLTKGFFPGVLIAGTARNISQNYVTPNDEVNAQIVSDMKALLSDIDPSMQSFNLEWGWNHEDLAGNPLQLTLAMISIVLLLIFHRKFTNKTLWHYSGLVLASYMLLAWIVRYDLYGIRYQLPFFVAFSPFFGVILETLMSRRLSIALAILLLLTAFPWVLFNRTRPLIAMRPSHDPFTIPCLAGCTTGSILNEPPEKTMFAVWGSLGSAYVNAMKQVTQTGCQNIGLKLDSNDLEYAYWWLLGAPQNGMRLESIVTYPELERYLDPNFKPCVIICTTCGDQPQLFGLERIGSYGDGRIKIYSGSNYDLAQP